MIDIPLPRLLDASGNTDRIIEPISESINLEITPLSYATMVLPVGETLPARAFVELFTNIGSVGIYRVRSPQDAYGEETTTAELEHAIVEVGDWLVRADITGSMAIQTAMTQVFSHYRGGKWQLGNITALGTDTITVAIEYERVLDAMLTILAMKPDCYLDFDFSTSPWTVSVKQRDATVTAEGRLSRNINSANVTYDDTDLCTRAYYPVDVMNQTTGEVTRTWYSVDADTISTYGVAERSVYNSDNTTAAEALATAQEYLNLYKRPKFGVQISAEELSSITGESLDRFAIGKLFRLSLTDYNTTIDQTITSLSWDDVYNAPTSVMVTLADEEAGTFDMVTALHNIDKNGGTVSGGRSSSGQQYKSEMVGGQYRTKFDQTDRYIDLVAQKTNTSGDILEQAGLYLDSQGVLVYADDFENNLGSKLEVQADKISMVVGTYQGSNYIKAGEIALAINNSNESVAHINADHVNISATSTLHTLAGAIEEDNNGNLIIKSAGGMRVRRTESGVTSEFGVFDNGNLTAGVIVDKVNGGSVYLKGSKVWVGDASTDQTLKKWATESDGLFAQNIGALSARIGSIEADYIHTSNLSSKIANIASLSVQAVNFASMTSARGGVSAYSGSFTTFSLGGTSIGISDIVSSVSGTDNGDGTYTLSYTRPGGSAVPYLTFSKAATLVTGWSGTSSTGQTYTATAGSQSDTFTLSGNWTMGSPSYPDTLYHSTWADGAVRLQEGYDLSSYKATQYNAGVTAGTASVTVSAAGWQGGSNVVSASNGNSVTISMPAVTMSSGAWSSHKKTVYAYSSAAGITGYIASEEVDATSEYNDGVTAGGTAAGLTINSTAGTVERSISSTTKSYAITATCSQAYNSTTHTYTATATSKAGTTSMGTATATTGVEAYNAGVTAGNTAAGVTSSWSGNVFTVTRAANTTTKSASCTVTIYPSTARTLDYGESVTVSALGNSSVKASVTITAPADRYQAGYNAGWAAAKAKISRSGNKIMVPPATVDGAAVEGYAITVIQGSISASRVTSSLYALSASASAYISGTAVATDSTSRNLSV